MAKADLSISEKDGVSYISVSGRANFECGMPLRSFTNNYSTANGKIAIDMSGCETMDSTFMGILTMLALKSKKLNIDLVIVNITENCKGLLFGLGVDRIFKYEVRECEAACGDSLLNGDAKKDKIGAAEAVVDAHKTLMDVNLDNVAKFEKVVEFAETDLERFKGEDSKK